MGYRGAGGYYPRGDYGYGKRRGDLLGDLGMSTDLAGGVDTGGGIWSDVGTFLGDIGLTGPAIGGAIVTGVKGLLGGGGGGGGAPSPPSSMPGGAVPRITRAGAPRGARLPRAGGGFRRHHMNPLNPKALRRALRRAQRFEHFAKQVLHVTSPKKHVSHFKLHRKRKRVC